ncbi:hypothetical protein [Rheinheimera sp. 1928-s]|uniref:hypothetical protein n=1 Tax=Rheinheimera sp. 1928-s TaxID=3033803 RepID=UPI00261C2651|nr:hypothetical protein [Rheinheimera sp. 1928-s]MDF3127357.1 hypothetical protein [Rheinheimera sp. 1928-s]
MKLILLPLLLLASAFTFAQQLDTPNYTVEIQQLCPEGEVQCQNVLYKGTSKVSGASIELKGKAWHSLCADGVTPCRFLGYQFNNGRIRYLVHDSGLLQVIGSSGKVVLEEQGVWDYQQDTHQNNQQEDPDHSTQTEPETKS